MNFASFIEPFQSISGLVDLFTLILMEIVLGIDNIIFIAIICGYIPNKIQASRARYFGLTLALVVRIILLSTISFIAHMVDPLFHIGEFGITGRGLILFGGGVFLLVKTSNEIYHKFREADHEEKANSRTMNFFQAVLQITFIDIVFSFDSIITAVGLSNNIPIMIMAVVVAMIVMLLFAPYVSEFIEKYPTLKMLALTFLLVIGGILLLESLEDAHILHLPENVDIKMYAYAALAFALSVEMLNIRMHNVKMKRSRKSDTHS
jgi:predicted tellurium resistance membrane protein TerC